MDAVLGYHLNPLTCGVAKFNLALAGRMRVPVVSIFDPITLNHRRPLLSLKLSEFHVEDVAALQRLLKAASWQSSFALFLHEWTGTGLENRLLQQASVVYCGNAEMVAQLRGLRPDAVEAWCPSTILEPRRFTPCELSVFSFGMAHKVRADFYGKLRTLLEKTERSYCLYLSTALHENTALDGSFTGAFEEMQTIFGSRIYFLGYLSDTAVYNYLLDTTFFAAFFDRGVRANNTTVNAAMQCESVVITNLDEYSPRSFVNLENVLDITSCTTLPTEPSDLKRLGVRARATATNEIGWEGLAATISKYESSFDRPKR